MNYQILQELKITLDAWIEQTETCEFVDNAGGCPIRKELLHKREILRKIQEKENVSKD